MYGRLREKDKVMVGRTRLYIQGSSGSRPIQTDIIPSPSRPLTCPRWQPSRRQRRRTCAAPAAHNPQLRTPGGRPIVR
jgi:hypothetical protein